MKSRNVLFSGVVGLALAITGCSKEPINNLTQEESRIYITNYDSTSSFASLKTFSVSDSVVVVRNGQASRELTSTDQGFINATITQMKAAGFTQVNKSNNPDVGLNVNRIYNTSTGVVRYDNFYGGYGGFYDPFYWGPRFGGFGYNMPYSYATYTIREGAISIDLLNLKDANANNGIKIVWTGLIRGSGIFNDDPNKQVKMLFDQSPYLKNQ